MRLSEALRRAAELSVGWDAYSHVMLDKRLGSMTGRAEYTPMTRSAYLRSEFRADDVQMTYFRGEVS